MRIVPQARAGIIERFGRYSKTLTPGLNIVVPFVDRLRPLIDLREQVVSFPPQPVITEDNLVVGIDTVLYFQVTDAKAVTYEIANYIQAIEQLTVTTLRNLTGGMDLEHDVDVARGDQRATARSCSMKRPASGASRSTASSSSRSIRRRRSKTRWKSRCAPTVTSGPQSLPLKGFKQSQILTAEGEKQSAILKAEGQAQAAVTRRRPTRRRRRCVHGPGEGDRHGLRSDSRRQAGRRVAGVSIPADAPADRQG